jgi:hypothetical protein
VVTSPTPVFVDDAKNRPLGGGQEFAKQEEAAALKREANDMKDGLASTTWALQETQAEEECLMGQVVLSPERRTQELAKKKERLEKKSGKRDKCQKIYARKSGPKQDQACSSPSIHQGCPRYNDPSTTSSRRGKKV